MLEPLGRLHRCNYNRRVNPATLRLVKLRDLRCWQIIDRGNVLELHGFWYLELAGWFG